MKGKLSAGRKWVKTRRVGEAMRVLKVSELNIKERIKDEWNVVSEKGDGVYREGVWYEKSGRWG